MNNKVTMFRQEELEMDKLPQEKKVEEISRLLRRINQGVDPKTLRTEANRLITSISAGDLASAEKRLVSDGYSKQLASQLSAAFVMMGILQSRNGEIRKKLPANHVLRMVLAEHEIMRCFLADLADVSEVIANMKNLKSTSAEFMKLSHIVEHLSATAEHIEREDDVIFPCLKKEGWTSLCLAAHGDHTYITIAIDDLIKLIASFNQSKIKEFKVKLNSITKYLCPTMTEHLFQEDNILYPIALEVVKDENVWKKIKAVCDDIGYCGVHT
jgi:DUF438 domain-containing protein